MIRLILSSIAVLGLTGCQHGSDRSEAVLSDGSPETMTALKAGLAEAMGRTYIQLGASDPTEQSMVSVLPLPLGETDDISLESPTLFDLVVENGVCMAINRATGEQTDLPDVPCRPV